MLQIIRQYKNGNHIIESITLQFLDNRLFISVKGSILDHESYKHYYIDVQYNNIEYDTPLNIDKLLEILHEPFPNGYPNIMEDIYSDIDVLPNTSVDDTKRFLKDYPNFTKRNVINKKYDSLNLNIADSFPI